MSCLGSQCLSFAYCAQRGKGTSPREARAAGLRAAGGTAGQAGVPQGSGTGCFLSLGIPIPQPTQKRVRPGDKTALLGKTQDTEASSS